MSLKNDVFGMSLAKLQLREVTAYRLSRRLVSLMPACRDTRNEMWAREAITVEQIVDSMGVYVLGHHPSSEEREFMRKLESLGLTRIDLIYLSASTVTLDKLRGVSKDELLNLPALVLGTVSKRMLETYAYAYRLRGTCRDDDVKRVSATITVGDILNFDQNLEHRTKAGVERELRNTLWKPVVETRELLKQLGIPHDVYFMRFELSPKADALLWPQYQLPKALHLQVVTAAQKEGVTPQELVVKAVQTHLDRKV